MRLNSSINNRKNNSNASKNKHISASSQERRDEEKRRMDRRNEVMIGKTSALDGEKDFSIDSTATEEEYLRQASRIEREIFSQTELGLTELKNFRLEESLKAFERVFELRPNAYCWQAGIVKYYLGDYVGGADIFARNARLYETKFGLPGSEERIWRDACELRYIKNPRNKEHKPSKEMIRQVEEVDEDCMNETKRVTLIVKDLFAASVNDDQSTLILSRAKLRAIGGSFDNNSRRPDQKMWKVNSWFYLGLHYDTLGESEESKKCMKMALRLCPSNGNGSDIIHALPLLHMSTRDWFDDDEFDIVEENPPAPVNSEQEIIETPSGITVDPILLQSIHDSISKMKYDGLSNALKIRGINHTGPKKELQTRLFNSLVKDVGLR